MATYRNELMNYCHMLTGTPWDAEDLYQETIIKAYRYETKLVDHPNPKAYLLKIASTTWISICRKNKVVVDGDIEEAESLSTIDRDPISIEDSVEELASSLPPKQAVVLLLIDIFSYSSSEVAEMINTKTGAVKSLLHRGRKNLSTNRIKEKNSTPQELIASFKDAITTKNPSLISQAYKRLIGKGVTVTYLKDKKRFLLYDPEGNTLGFINT